MRKKWLAILLSAALIASLIPAASAASSADMARYGAAAEALWNDGLFLGSGASFDLDQPLVRSTGATMVVRLLGKEAEAKAGRGTTPFADVPAWAAPYVGYAYQNQLTNGVSATAFGSDTPMTAAQFLTLVLRALGYDDKAGDFTWDKAADKAIDLGLVQSADLQGDFLRGQAAVISLNALSQKLKGTDKTLRSTITLPGKPSGPMPTWTADTPAVPEDLRGFDEMTVQGFLSKLGPGYTDGSLIGFDPTVGYNPYLAEPVYLDFGLRTEGAEDCAAHWKWCVRKGAAEAVSFTLDELPDAPGGERYVAFELAGGVISYQDVSMSVKVENARIELPGKTIALPQANGTFQSTAKYEAPPYQGQSWLFGGLSAGSAELPDVQTLRQGAFKADVTLLDASGPSKVDYYLSLATGDPPAPTAEWFKFLKAEGFRSIRFQMSWFNFTNDQTYAIDPAWLDKVEATLKLALDEGFYCTISVCGDAVPNYAIGLTDDEAAQLAHTGGWLLPDGKAETEKRFASLWTQIAERFKAYDEHLIFESVNEPAVPDSLYDALGVKGSPSGNGVAELGKAGEALNRLNQIFVDSVRATGGSNAKRFLFVPPYFNKGVESTLKAFRLPTDAANHTAVCLNRYLGGEDVGGGDVFPAVQKYLLPQGIGVVFTEFGATAELFSEEERAAFAAAEIPQARALNIPIMWYAGNWGHFQGHPNEHSPCFCLYDPYTFAPAFPKAIDLLMGR